MDILPGCMTGNTLDAMAEGVGKAAVVLIFVTRPYKESANCRLEGSYAQDLRKPIIPVILESGYRMDGSWGWLGLIVAGKLYHDFSGPEEFSARMNALLDEIRKVGVAETGCDIVSGGAPAGSLLLEERSEEDLTAWLLTILGPRGLEQVAPVLRAHRITHRGMLTELQERDMDRLGLRIGHRVRLREALGAGGARAVPRKPGVPTGLCEDVREWLAELGLSNCIRIFEEQQILTMETVRCLRDEDIAAAIPLIGDRIILRRALRNLPGKD
jgi:hypothetical protein